MQTRMSNPATLLPDATNAIQTLLKATRKGGVPEKTLELVHLRVNRPVDLLIAVPDAHRQDAAEKVEVPSPLAVPKILGLGMIGDQRFGVIVDDAGEDILLVFSQDLVAIHRHLVGTRSGNRAGC